MRNRIEPVIVTASQEKTTRQVAPWVTCQNRFSCFLFWKVNHEGEKEVAYTRKKKKARKPDHLMSSIRLTASLHRKIARAAKAGMRSINAEMNHRLEGSFTGSK